MTQNQNKNQNKGTGPICRDGPEGAAHKLDLSPYSASNSALQYRVLLAGSFVAALALRLGCTIWFQGLNAAPKCDAAPDQCDYELLAYHMSIGEGYALYHGVPTACRAPGTSFVLLPAYWLFGRSFVAARIWFCVLSAATCLATAWMARRAFGRTVSLVASFGVALYPGHFYYSMHFLSEVPFALWLALACGFGVRAIETSTWADHLVAGLFWGSAILVRPQAILIAPVAILLGLLLPRYRNLTNSRTLVMQGLAALAVTGPWVARNSIVIGKPTMSTIVGGYTFWGGNNELVLKDPKLRGSWVRSADLVDASHPLLGNELEREAAAWRYGLDFVRTHPARLPGLCWMKIWRLVSPFEETPNRTVFWAFAMSWIVVGPLFAAGVFFAVRRNPSAAWLLLVPVLMTILTAVIFYGSVRFRDAIAPVILTLAAVGAVELVNRCETTGRRPLVATT